MKIEQKPCCERKEEIQRLEQKPFWLSKMEQNTPEPFRKLELEILMHLTAGAFGENTHISRQPNAGKPTGASGENTYLFRRPGDGKPAGGSGQKLSFKQGETVTGCRPGRGEKPLLMCGKSSRECLKLYREFTVYAVKSCTEEELPAFRQRLYRRAFRIGRCLALLPGIRAQEKRKRLIELLYRNIGIKVRDTDTQESDEGVWNIKIPHCSFSPAYTPRVCRVMSGLDAGIICGILGGGKLEFVQRITEGCPYCTAHWRR